MIAEKAADMIRGRQLEPYEPEQGGNNIDDSMAAAAASSYHRQHLNRARHSYTPTTHVSVPQTLHAARLRSDGRPETAPLRPPTGAASVSARQAPQPKARLAHAHPAAGAHRQTRRDANATAEAISEHLFDGPAAAAADQERLAHLNELVGPSGEQDHGHHTHDHRKFVHAKYSDSIMAANIIKRMR